MQKNASYRQDCNASHAAVWSFACGTAVPPARPWGSQHAIEARGCGMMQNREPVLLLLLSARTPLSGGKAKRVCIL